MATTTLYLDGSGRVVIPKTIRDELQLEPGTEFELEKGDDSITLRPVRAKGHVRLKDGVWVFNSGSGKTYPADLVNQVRDRIREEREKQFRGEPD